MQEKIRFEPAPDPVAAALNRIADELKRYNDLHEPAPLIYRTEAESFRATYDREDPEKRELHDFLTGKAEDRERRPPAKQDGRGKKKARS